jgi:hypothetical protein
VYVERGMERVCAAVLHHGSFMQRVGDVGSCVRLEPFGTGSSCVCEQCHAFCTPDLLAMRRVSCDVAAPTYNPLLVGRYCAAGVTQCYFFIVCGSKPSAAAHVCCLIIIIVCGSEPSAATRVCCLSTGHIALLKPSTVLCAQSNLHAGLLSATFCWL